MIHKITQNREQSKINTDIFYGRDEVTSSSEGWKKHTKPSIEQKEKSSFFTLTSIPRRQYKGFVLSVHEFCTHSTWALYSEYMAHVLQPERIRTTLKRHVKARQSHPYIYK